MSMMYPGVTHCSTCWGKIGECNCYKDMASRQQVSKLKLIDILVMISKGELKEGTKVKIKENTYEFTKQYRTDIAPDLVREDYEGEKISIFEDFYLTALLNEEVELIEPEHIPGPTKMIEELNINNFYKYLEFKRPGEVVRENLDIEDSILALADKLNEVIRYINKED